LLSGNTKGPAKIWDVFSASVQTTIPHQEDSPQAIWSSDGKYVIVSSNNASILVWNPQLKQSIYSLESISHHMSSLDVQYECLLSSVGKKVFAWNLKSAKRSEIYNESFDTIGTLALHPKGGTFFLSSGNICRQVKRANGQIIQTFESHTKSITSLASVGSSILLSGSQDGTIKLWRISDSSLLHTFRIHRGTVSTIDFSHYGNWLASGGGDGIIRIWDLSFWN